MKHCELAEHLLKQKRRVVLHGDHVNDALGYQAVFTEHGASASQVAGAALLDAIFTLPAMDGEASDAISAYTRACDGWSQTSCASGNCKTPQVWMRLHRIRHPANSDSVEDLVVLDFFSNRQLGS